MAEIEAALVEGIVKVRTVLARVLEPVGKM